MKKIIKVIQDNPSLMHLTWIINNICTNKCSYCPKDLHTGTNHNYDWENAREFFKILFERYPNIHCSVAGGEPSISPFFPELVKIFYDKGHTIGLTSNAAKTVAYWQEIAPYLTYISFSYHPEFADPKFFEKVSIASQHTAVTARVMMHPKYWDECVSVYNRLLEIKTIIVEVVRIIDWGGGSDSECSIYTDEQIKWFNENGNQGLSRVEYRNHFKEKGFKSADLSAKFHFDTGEIDAASSVVSLINQGYTNFYGYECEIGLKSLFINHEGYVFLGNCGLGGSIGHINNPKEIKWPRKSVICTKKLCHCTTDVGINKWEM